MQNKKETMKRGFKCPNCGETFEINESSYKSIVSQIKDAEFTKDLNERIKIEEAKKDVEFSKKILLEEMSKKEKDLKIKELESKLNGTEADAKKNLENELKTAKLNAAIELEKKIALSNKEINSKEIKIAQLESTIKSSESDKKLEIKNIQDSYKRQINEKNEDIAQLKESKMRLSTKMVGESLEQHCEIQFNEVRHLGFKNASFGKDNDSSEGSKGDFIFKDYTDDKLEYMSIMFEMKNENETTATKKKNEDFLKELDKDRREKNCEYAILVSCLEIDNELYNTGIVDVSHKYPKMYVVRPQFFIPIITLLRNAALNSVEFKKEIELQRSQNIDITNFENDISEFKIGFNKNYANASNHYENAIKNIDASIKNLEKTRSSLVSSENSLRLASNKLENLNIKKLTKKNPTMALKFAELKNSKD